MSNIIINGNEVRFAKALWEQEDITLAKCQWMSVEDIKDEAGKVIAITITADLRCTFRKALHIFIESVYPAFWTQPQYQDEREALLRDIDTVYKKIYQEYSAIHRERLPWYNKLYKHQKQALVSMHSRKVNMLSFQPRLGKTISTASISVVHNIERTVVVTMDLGKWNWLYDMTDPKWEGESKISKMNFTVYASQKSQNLQAFDERFIIVNYESLGKFINKIMDSHIPAGHIIFSECQKLKNHTTAIWKACHKLVSLCPDARITFESGTPVLNRTNDMYAYFRIAGHPLGENYADFKRNYSETDKAHGNVVASRNIPDLQKRMSNFVLRRTQKECTDMPEHNYIELKFSLGEWEAEYRKAIFETLKAKGKLAVESAIQSINRIMALAKVPGIIEHVEQLIDAGEKVIVFFGYTMPIEKMALHFGNKAAIITGEVIGGHAKMEQALRFKNDPECMVMLANLQAAGHSVDLSVSSNVILGNYPMSPKGIEQALDRTKNLAKIHASNAYFCTCVGSDGKETVDERLRRLVAGKDSDINWLFDGSEAKGMLDDIPELLWKELMEQYKLTPDEQKEIAGIKES
jgi:hypothetical protein